MNHLWALGLGAVFTGALMGLFAGPVVTILRHGRRVAAAAPPQPGCARAILLGLSYDVEVGLFRHSVHSFIHTLMVLSWLTGSLVGSVLVCAGFLLGDREPGSVPVSWWLGVLGGVALTLFPLHWLAGRALNRLVDRISQRV
jgi:hypothetical protein